MTQSVSIIWVVASDTLSKELITRGTSCQYVFQDTYQFSTIWSIFLDNMYQYNLGKAQDANTVALFVRSHKYWKVVDYLTKSVNKNPLYFSDNSSFIWLNLSFLITLDCFKFLTSFLFVAVLFFRDLFFHNHFQVNFPAQQFILCQKNFFFWIIAF